MTIFTKIINREIPAEIVFEDDQILAFKDVNPVAPVHILVIPKRHIVQLSDSTDGDVALLGILLRAVAKIAEQQGLDSKGYRVVINNGEDAGQTVDHLHLHLIGGKPLGWPPYTDSMKTRL